MPTDIDAAGFVLVEDEGDLFVAALNDRMLDCLDEQRRPTPFDLALGFQLGTTMAAQGIPEDEVGRNVDLIYGVFWDGLVDDWAAMLQEQGAMIGRDEVARLVHQRFGVAFSDLVADQREATLTGYRITVCAVLCVIAGTFPFDMLPPDWPHLDP